MSVEDVTSIAPLPNPASQPASDMTLHQLRIFWTVANSDSLTKAAKQLGLAQPSLSQQLSRLENAIGLRLFERRSNQMELTDVGAYLLPRAGALLREMHALEDGLAAFRGGSRATIRISGVTSVLRVILPQVMQRLKPRFEDLHFDIHDNAPADVVELLYARKINIGLVAANTIAEAGLSFLQVPVLEDPYLLAVPESVDLSGAPRLVDLDPEARRVLNQSIQFSFGTQHANRVATWYEQRLPDNQVVARCRNYDMALEMVRSGLGVCLIPALTAVNGERPLPGVRLYEIDEPARRIVALVQSQYRRLQPYSDFLDILGEVGAAYTPPAALPAPAFLTGAGR